MRWVVFLIFFACYHSSAQTPVSGLVLDNHKKPVAGVSIAIENSYDGATTDSLGKFSFTSYEKGSHKILVTSSGYKSFEQLIDLSGSEIDLDITIREEVTELKAVVISVGAFEASDQKKGTTLSSIDVVTTASANADITGAIKTLPGAQQVGESEGLFVRGGTAEESKIFIDGTLVNNFFFTSTPGQASRGRFNPFLFRGTVFSSGGYSALYGQALSSVLLLESIDFPDRSSADFGISYLGVNAGFQKISKKKNFSWGITYSYVNLALVFNLIKQKFDYFKIPVLNEGDLNFRVKTSKTGILKYYGYLNSTKVGYRLQDVDSLSLKNAFDLKNINTYHNISWREKLGSGWGLQTGLSYSNNRNDIANELQDGENIKQNIDTDPLYANKNFDLTNRGDYFNGKLVFEKRLSGLSAIRFGGEYNYSTEKNNFKIYDSAKFSGQIEENLFGGFAETDIYLTNSLAAKMGVRTEHSALLDQWNLAPRFSLAYKFPDNSQLSFAYGKFYQTPDNKYLPAINALHYANATHYILQFQKLTSLRTFRTEVFYKNYNDLFKTDLVNGRFIATDNKGFGDAKGIEFFWRDKKTIKNFDYWLSYSFLDTKRDFLNYPYSIEPPFAAKHTASLVVKKFVTKMKTQFNASYTFATGRPYYYFGYDSSRLVYSIGDQGRTKDYNSLSLSVNYLPALGKPNAKAFIVFVASLTNVLGANQIYTYNYSANGANKVAVTPPSKRFLYLGCFISLGVDRTQDAINNNL